MRRGAVRGTREDRRARNARELELRQVKYAFTDYHAELQGTGPKATLSQINGEITATTTSTTTTYFADALDVSGSLERDGYNPVPLEGPLNLDCTYSSTASSGSVNARPSVSWTSGGSTGGDTGANCDPSYFSQCHQTVNGVSWEGAPWPKRCGRCPDGTDPAGEDTVTTPGEPYWLCVCN